MSLFKQTVPAVTLDPGDFRQTQTWNGETAYIAGDKVSDSVNLQSRCETSDRVVDVKWLNVELSEFDCVTLAGTNGDAARVAIRIIPRMVHMTKATEPMDVSQAHVDGAWFGPGSVVFGKRMRDSDGTFRVSTTMNNIEQRRWRSLGNETKLARPAMNWQKPLSK